jgi:ketosteroid isomerase-like protein
VTDPAAATPAPDLEALTRAYLDAFEARDLERCLAFYTDEARIDFQMGVFQGRNGIEDWHRDRFAANLRLVRIESISVKGDTVIVEAIAASDRLTAWKIKSLSGRMTLRFGGGRIVEARFAPRVLSPVDMIRSS